MSNSKKILVTGASGLLGSHLVYELLENGYNVRAVIHKREQYLPRRNNLEIVRGDLTNPEFCRKICKGIDHVFHLAVETGSIVKNFKHPASIMTPTILMDFNMLKSSHEEGVKKYLYCSCACVYPEYLDDMKEELAWNGLPPKTHETISWSKRISELQCQSFYREYGDKIAIVRPSNTFGPYDIFDVENSHVISAFIRKASEKTNPFVIWGDGEQIREFVYAKDVVKGMILALDKYAVADPVNLGGGTAIKIKDLAEMIISRVGYSPRIECDQTKPTGHRKRVLNSDKSKLKLGFVPSTSLEEGLRETIEWYSKNR